MFYQFRNRMPQMDISIKQAKFRLCFKRFETFFVTNNRYRLVTVGIAMVSSHISIMFGRKGVRRCAKLHVGYMIEQPACQHFEEMIFWPDLLTGRQNSGDSTAFWNILKHFPS